MPEDSQATSRTPALVEPPQSIQVALEYLLNTCNKEKAAVAGFCFRYEGGVFLLNFGNVTDAASSKLYDFLCQMTEQKLEAGLTVKHFLPRPQ